MKEIKYLNQIDCNILEGKMLCAAIELLQNYKTDSTPEDIIKDINKVVFLTNNRDRKNYVSYKLVTMDECNTDKIMDNLGYKYDIKKDRAYNCMLFIKYAIENNLFDKLEKELKI